MWPPEPGCKSWQIKVLQLGIPQISKNLTTVTSVVTRKWAALVFRGCTPKPDSKFASWKMGQSDPKGKGSFHFPKPWAILDPWAPAKWCCVTNSKFGNNQPKSRIPNTTNPRDLYHLSPRPHPKWDVFFAELKLPRWPELKKPCPLRDLVSPLGELVFTPVGVQRWCPHRPMEKTYGKHTFFVGRKVVRWL